MPAALALEVESRFEELVDESFTDESVFLSSRFTFFGSLVSDEIADSFPPSKA